MEKIAVFGVGHLGKIHTKCIHEHVPAQLVGVYDADYERCKAVAAEFGVPAFAHAEELLNACTIADIVTTTSAHFEMAKMALEAGKHTFIEKPVTTTTAQAEALLQLKTEKNLKVQVGHVERFNPAFIAAAPHIKNPAFIETHRLAMFNPRGNDVSVILDLMIHDLDVILHIVNSEVVDIQASGVAIVTDTFDIANVRLHFANGCVANLTASRISLKNMRKTRIFQPNAYIGVDFLEKKTEIIHIEAAPETNDNPFAMILDLGNGQPKKQIIIESPTITMNNAIADELTSFVRAVETDTTPAVTLNDGYKALHIAQQILAKMNV